MKIETEHGYITFFEIDQTEEGWEDYEGWVIDRLVVKDKSRGNGHGRDLLSKAIEAMGNADIYLTACPLDQDTNLERLVSLYESEGFSVASDDERPWPLMVR